MSISYFTRLSDLLEAIPDALIIVNPLAKIVHINHQTETLFGYSRNELLEKPVEQLMPERYRDEPPPAFACVTFTIQASDP